MSMTDGWERCGKCHGYGKLQVGQSIFEGDCLDCAHGLVPPDWMTEAAAEAAHEESRRNPKVTSSEWRWLVPALKDMYRRQARAALVGAARKEREQP